MTNKPTLAIVLEGGLVQSVISDDPDSFDRVIVIDYDTDGCDYADLTNVPQSDRTETDAYVSDWTGCVAKPDIDLAETLRRLDNGIRATGFDD